MVRIVSGAQEYQDPGLAFLAGYQDQAKLRQAQQEEARRQMTAMAEIQQTQMKLQKEKAKALKDANERAQLGEVRAIQQQEMERAIANLPPDKKRLADYTQLRSKLTSQDAIDMLDKSFASVEKDIQTQEQRQAFESEVQRAVKDGLIMSNDVVGYTQRYQSGEPPENLTQELGEMRMKRAAVEANVDENTEYIAQIDAAIAAMPAGRSKKLAMILANEYKASPSRLEDEGSGPKVLAAIQKVGVGSARELEEREQAEADRRAEILGPSAAAPGLGGMTSGERNKQMMRTPTGPVGFGLLGDTFGAGGPNIPPLDPSFGTHATVNRGKVAGQPQAAKPPADRAAFVREATIIARQSPDKRQAALELEKRGYDLNDPDVQADLLDAFEAAYGAATTPRSIAPK